MLFVSISAIAKENEQERKKHECSERRDEEI
jgi:hypothetical protein